MPPRMPIVAEGVLIVASEVFVIRPPTSLSAPRTTVRLMSPDWLSGS